LRQLARDRGGFDSYAWVENLLGFDVHDVDEIVPASQDLAVGDTVRPARADRFPETRLEVASITPEQSLVLLTPDRPPWWVRAFVLDSRTFPPTSSRSVTDPRSGSSRAPTIDRPAVS